MADWKRYNIEFALKKGKTEKDIFDALEYNGDSLAVAVQIALDVADEAPFQMTSSADDMEHEMEYYGYGDTADANIADFIEAVEDVMETVTVTTTFEDGDETVEKYESKENAVDEQTILDRVKNRVRNESILNINVDFVIDEILDGSAGMELTDEEMDKFANTDVGDLVDAMIHQWNVADEEFSKALTDFVVAIARSAISR